MTDKRFYVYSISVDGVIRYIGKGSDGRLHFHVIEAQRINRRRTRGASTDAACTMFYRKLAAALRRGASIEAVIVVNNLSEPEAYRLENEKIEELHRRKRAQLWNTIDERLVGILGRHSSNNSWQNGAFCEHGKT
jgi:hypothetical protein